MSSPAPISNADLDIQVDGLANELKTPDGNTNSEYAGTVLTGCTSVHIKKLHGGGAVIPFVKDKKDVIVSVIIGSTKKLKARDYKTRPNTTHEWTDGLGNAVAISEFPAELRLALEKTKVCYICSGIIDGSGGQSKTTLLLKKQVGNKVNLHSFDPKKKIYTFVGHLTLLKLVDVTEETESGKFTNTLFLFE